MIAFSGVRSSWLMLARNTLLCSLGLLELAVGLLELLHQSPAVERRR